MESNLEKACIYSNTATDGIKHIHTASVETLAQMWEHTLFSDTYAHILT